MGSAFSVHRDHVGFVVGRQHGTLSKIGRETKTTLEVNDQDPSCQFVGIVIGGRSMDDVRAQWCGEGGSCGGGRHNEWVICQG